MMWAVGGLVALGVVAAFVLMGRGPTSRAEPVAAPLPPLADTGADETLLGGSGDAPPVSTGEGFPVEPAPMDDTAGGEGSAWREQGEGEDVGLPRAGSDPLDGWTPPGVEDVPFEIEVPGTWSVEEDQATGGLTYLSDGGPDPLVLYVMPLGPAVGNQLDSFTQFMITGMVNQGATVSHAEPVEVGGRPARHLSLTKPGNGRPGTVWLLDAGENVYSILAELPADPAARAALSDDLEAAVQSFDVTEG